MPRCRPGRGPRERRETLRRQATIAYEVAILQLAPAYLRGHLATFSPRSYPDTETQQPWGVASLLWAHFGGIPPKDPIHQGALRVLIGSHRLPEGLHAPGEDRSRPYVYRALLNRWALDHFVNRDYVLHYGSVLIAISSATPFQWDPQAGTTSP